MRTPNIYDFVYVAGYDKSLFQVIGVNHPITDKHPFFELVNVKTLKEQVVLCPIKCSIEELYGVPFSDVEFHFDEYTCWHYIEEEDDDEMDDFWVSFCEYDFMDIGGRFIFSCDTYDPQPEKIEYIHDLQQYHRGIYGEELDIL